MASQESFELSSLLDHRFMDHEFTDAADTTRSVYPISTTDQASESIRPTPSSYAGPNYTVQDPSETAFSSKDRSLLITPQKFEPSEEIVQTRDGRLRASAPWPLRRGPLLGLIAYLVALIATLEIVHFLSNRNQGLTTAKQDTSYLWKYLPTALLTIIAFYWNKLDYHARALMPWKLMTEKPQSADRSLFMDYVSDKLVAVLLKSIRYRHVPVITSTIGSLTVILVIVASTGLFVLQPTSIHVETAISVLSTFDGTLFDSSEVGSFPVLAVSSILSGNLSVDYPPNTNIDYAVDMFSLRTALDDLDALKNGSVEAFHADLACNNGSVKNISVTPGPYTWDIEVDLEDGDCSTGLKLVATPAETTYEASNFMPIGGIFLKQCPGVDQSKIFVFFGQVNVSAPANATGFRHLIMHSFNSTVLVCTPNHALQEAVVTTNSAAAVINIEIQKTLDKNITSPWKIWSAFNTSLQAAVPTFLEGPFSRRYDHGANSYDNFFAVLLATWSRQPAEYLNRETLMRDSQRLYRTTASQIADRLLRANSTRVAPGSYNATQLRVTLKGTALRITETGLAILTICACLVMTFSPCTPTTLSSLAVMIQRNDQLKLHLSGSGEMSLDHIRENFSGQSFSSDRTTNSIRLHGSEAALRTSSASAARITTWWRPAAFSIYMKIAALTLPLAIVACLEVTYQVSCDKDGLEDAPLGRYWHYAWTWIPASTMTLVRLLYASLTWSVALLDPYSILRTRSVVAQHALCNVNLSKASIQITYQSSRLRRYALLATSVSALLASLLTIIVSGLIYVQSTRRTESLVIPLADHISSPAGQILDIAAWSQASLCAANLLYQGYGSYPKGTYQNFVFPNLKQDTSNNILTTGAKLLNLSSIDINVGVILSNMTCRVMDPAGFRYTVNINGSNDPKDTTSTGVWYGGSPGDSYLNLTHIDLAGYGCDNPGPNCSDEILSIGVDLQANSTRFSYQVYEDSFTYTWTDPSAWPNNEALQQAFMLRNESTYVIPNVTLLYGTWNATSAQIHGIACHYDVRQGSANITYDVSTSTVTSVQPYEQSFVTLSNYSQALPWTGAYMEHLDGLLPNGNLWQTVLNNTPDAFYDTSTGSIQLATQVSDLYNQFFTQFYNTALRNQNFTADTINATATLVDENYQRIFQSGISTRILEALLLSMWLCACIVYYLFDTKTLLPKNPCSIAAQASLLVDSKFLDMIPEGAENATLEELVQMTPFKDHLFSMGWWDDGMGGRRFGIDVGMADFDKGDDDDVEKMEESAKDGDGGEQMEEGMVVNVDERVSIDIVGPRT